MERRTTTERPPPGSQEPSGPGRLPPLGTPTGPGDEASGRSPRGRPWALALAGLAALALGLGLGVLLGFLLDDGDTGDAAGSSAPAAPTTEGVGDEARTSGDVIPQRCLDAVELADDGLVLLDNALSSVGAFDPGRLDTVLQAAEDLRPDLERAVEDCQAEL